MWQRIENMIFCITILLLFITTGRSQTSGNDRLVVEFSNPKEAGFITVSLINGGITVNGYDGTEVIIEANSRSKKIGHTESSHKAKGMKRIGMISTGLSVEEENNKMEVSVQSWKRTMDVVIRAPRRTNLKLSCVNAGDIIVNNIGGEVDVSNINGKVTLTNISGAVVAHALNKDLVVTLDKVDPKKSMSFSTLNGDIDVTFPSKLKADVKLQTDNGEIYSDFDIKIVNKPQKIIKENNRKTGGKYIVEIESVINGSINGGGPEFQFKSFNGDILIRKKN